MGYLNLITWGDHGAPNEFPGLPAFCWIFRDIKEKAGTLTHWETCPECQIKEHCETHCYACSGNR